MAKTAGAAKTIAPDVAPDAKLVRDFKAARRVSTPLVGVQTPDMAATIDTLVKAANGGTTPPACFQHDLVRGLNGINDEGAKQLARILADKGIDPATTGNPVEALTLAQNFPPKSILFMMNAQRLYSELSVIQAIWNLRDTFKLNSRMLVLLGPSLRLPPEIEGDVIVLDEPLPSPAECAELIRKQYENADLPAPSAEIVEKATDAVMGLPQFTVEQITAMSLSKAKQGVDLDLLWDRKRTAIAQTPGLSVWQGGESYDAIGGCANIKRFLDRLIAGRTAFNAVVFIDEIEKAMAGASGPVGDSSGTSQDQLMQLLTFMQDKRTPGMIFIGHPGVAKSAVAKATGNKAGVPTIQMDLGGMKASLVGQSEERIRQALKVVDAVSGGRPLFIATCNDIGVLKPELRRRFKLGTFMFDLPSADERDAIWLIYLRKYQLPDTQRPDDADWTGAEIENCCELAWALDTSLVDAARYIVPIAKAAAGRVDKLRSDADGKFISASYEGVYLHPTKLPEAAQLAGVRGDRKIALQ